MTLADVLAWAGEGTTLLATWAYARRDRTGPLLGLASNVPWIALGCVGHMPGLIVGSAAFTLIHLRNYRKFTKWQSCQP